MKEVWMGVGECVWVCGWERIYTTKGWGWGICWLGWMLGVGENEGAQMWDEVEMSQRDLIKQKKGMRGGKTGFYAEGTHAGEKKNGWVGSKRMQYAEWTNKVHGRGVGRWCGGRTASGWLWGVCEMRWVVGRKNGGLGGWGSVERNMCVVKRKTDSMYARDVKLVVIICDCGTTQ